MAASGDLKELEERPISGIEGLRIELRSKKDMMFRMLIALNVLVLVGVIGSCLAILYALAYGLWVLLLYCSF
jgi:hypothetical protein